MKEIGKEIYVFLFFLAHRWERGEFDEANETIALILVKEHDVGSWQIECVEIRHWNGLESHLDTQLCQHLLFAVAGKLIVDIEKLRSTKPLKESTLILQQGFHSIFNEQLFTTIILVSSFSLVLAFDYVSPHHVHLFHRWCTIGNHKKGQSCKASLISTGWD